MKVKKAVSGGGPVITASRAQAKQKLTPSVKIGPIWGTFLGHSLVL